MFKKLLDYLFDRKGKIDNQKTVIVVVDDSEVDRRFMTRILTGKGYTVFAAANGDEGLRLVQEKKPSMVFLDFSIPGGLSGKEVCIKLKKDENLKHIPITFLTGSIVDGRVIECYDAGAEYYLAKPVDARTVLHQVKIMIQDAEMTFFCSEM